MKRALYLAHKAFPACMPNPGVGAVIVHQKKIIGEGYTQAFGGAHAEVMAIESVENKKLLTESQMYVTLEPCNHFGKTPPCSQLIGKHKIPEIFIATQDPSEAVNGKGIAHIKAEGSQVYTGLLEAEARKQNQRFFTFYEKKRPYVILKWAQSADGFMAPEEQEKGMPYWLSSSESRSLVHQWRAEEMAILVGTKTALLDNPSLTVRHTQGRNPLRILIDRELKVPPLFNLFSEEAPTYVFNAKYNSSKGLHHWICVDFEKDLPKQILTFLFEMKIQSLIVEGGAYTLNQFLAAKLWDEARVFESKHLLNKGLTAPKTNTQIHCSKTVSSDNLRLFLNPE